MNHPHPSSTTWIGRRLRVAVAATLSAALIASGSVLAGAASAAPADPADTVYVNGRVVTFIDGGADIAFAQALAVTDGIITAVGDDTAVRARIGADTQVYDLGGRLLMPGLGDGHLHGAEDTACDLDYEGGTIDTVLGKIRACLLSPEQAPYLNSNYTLQVSNFMGEGMIPSNARLGREVLDRLSADPAVDPLGTGTTRPIVVAHMDLHKTYTNTRAIENGQVTADTDPGGGFIGIGEDGFPNGQFADFYPPRPWGDSLPRDPDAGYRLLAKNIAYSNSLGITQIVRPGGGHGDAQNAARLSDEGLLTVHLNQALWGFALRGNADPASVDRAIAGYQAVRDEYDGYSNPNSPGELAVDTIKIPCDGVPEFPGQTASMEDPYNVNVGTEEDPVWEPGTSRGEDPSCEDAALGFDKLDAAGWNIHVHGLGNRASRVALDNFEHAAAVNPPRERRNTITHLEFVNESEVPRFKELGVIASMSLQWAQRDAWTTTGIEGYIDQDVRDRIYPARELLDAGAIIAAGSDWPVTKLVPWRQLESAVTRTGPANEAAAIYPGALAPEQAITLVEAVRAQTWGVAYQRGQEDVTGSIEVGKLADLVVTDQNIFDVPIEQVDETNVLLTSVSGKVVYAAENSPLVPSVGPGAANPTPTPTASTDPGTPTPTPSSGSGSAPSPSATLPATSSGQSGANSLASTGANTSALALTLIAAGILLGVGALAAVVGYRRRRARHLS